MRYRKTRLISLSSYTSRKNAPKDFFEILKREVEKDEACTERSFTNQNTGKVPPRPSQSQLKPSPGLLNLFRSNVEGFFLAFRP